MAAYQIFTDATADVSKELFENLPQVQIIPMQVKICQQDYSYGSPGDLGIRDFYEMQRAGHFATTSQINPFEYTKYFEPVLQQGKDILYLCFSSGMSSTLQSAERCISLLQDIYPNRKIICVDTLCASAGEGFLVREAARKQAEGLSIEELAAWIEKYRLQVCHWFTVDEYSHLEHGGRVSATEAAVGKVLKIKPLLHVDETGRLAVVEKVRGQKQAIRTQLSHMERSWIPSLSNLVVIGHGDCPENAEKLHHAVANQFPSADIHVVDIGPIIGTHTGPGILALSYWGEKR